MGEKQYCYVNKNGEEKYLFTTYINKERVLLKNKLSLNEIRFTGNHWLLYCYFLENIHLDKFFKANETIAEDIGVHKNTVKQLKKDFEKIQILKMLKENGISDVCHFTRLVKITETKNVPDKNPPKQKLSRGRDKKSPGPEQNLSPNNKAEEFNNKEAKKTAALIKERLLELGISAYQFKKYFDNNYSDDYFQDKIDQTLFIETFHSERFKGKGRGSYLFNSIMNNWVDEGYEKYKTRKKTEAEKQQIEENRKKREEKQRMTDEDLTEACLEYYNLLDDEARRVIDMKIDQEIPDLFRGDELKYNFAFESKKILILKELLLERRG